MVKRLLLVVSLYSSTMGLSCGTPVLTCGNPLDASEFGFTLTIPEAFACKYSAPDGNLVSPSAAVVMWTAESTSSLLTLTVFDLAQGSIPEVPAQLNYSSMADYTATIATFTQTLGQRPDATGGVFYIAQATLPGGAYAVRVMLGVETAGDAAVTILHEVLDGFALVGN